LGDGDRRIRIGIHVNNKLKAKGPGHDLSDSATKRIHEKVK
jgi:hypothetical protein